MIAAILIGLAKANLAAGAAVLLVMAVRPLVRPGFGAQASYLLWLAPLAAGLAVLAPHPAARSLIAPVVLTATTAMDEVVAAAPTSLSAGPDLTSVIFGLWVAGAVAAVGLLLRRQAAFLTAMGPLEPLAAGGVFRAQSPNVGPAVVGVFRPRIVTPSDFETRFGAGERELILAHERVHLRRGDAAVNAIACAVQCLCWFNPLAHLAARMLRIDQELACDATVIGRFPADRRTYAELLLKTQLAAQPLPLGCHWPAGAEHPLKARIAMLKSPLPGRAVRAVGAAVVAGLTLGAGALAWAAQPGAGSGPGAAERAEALKQLTAQPSSSWIAVPTPQDVARYYPAGAREAGQRARVHVACKSTPSGRMKGCTVLDVTVQVPEGEGAAQATQDKFGGAALQLARYFQAREPNSATFYIDFGAFQSNPRHEQSVSYAPGSYTPPAGFAEPRTNGQSTRAAPYHSIWIKKPTGEDMVRLYPAEALAKGLTGDVTMSCKVGADGRLNGCTIDRATVAGDSDPAPAADPGFGAATLELAKLFQMEPTDRQGVPTAGTDIRIPVRFTLPRPPQPATPS